MGWLFMQSLGGFSGPSAYLDNQFTSDRPGRCSRVLRSALVSMRTYYAAVEVLRPDKDREVFAAVCLVKYNPRDREGYVFGYKDMDETMGPHESACPVAVLDLLTPTDNKYALQWRARCRKAAEERASKARLHPADRRVRLADHLQRRRVAPQAGGGRQPEQAESGAVQGAGRPWPVPDQLS